MDTYRSHNQYLRVVFLYSSRNKTLLELFLLLKSDNRYKYIHKYLFPTFNIIKTKQITQHRDLN